MYLADFMHERGPMTQTAPVSTNVRTETERDVVVTIGALSREDQAAVREAAKDAALDVVMAPATPDASGMLAAGRRARAIVIDLDGPTAARVLRAARSDALLADVPVVGLARTPTDLSFAELLDAGGDDAVASGSPDALVSRLRALPSARQRVHVGTRTAIVAAPNAASRNVLARSLREVGYSVQFAADADELHVAWETRAPDLVVVDAGLPPSGGAREVVAARAVGRDTPAVVVAPPRLARETRAALAGSPRTAVLDAFSPPDGVVFLSNEISAGVRSDQRAAPRLLYGTRVWVRRAGTDGDCVGFSYTVSEGGIFVRTLAPFAREEELWIELFPPRCSRRVRLAASIRWTRRFGRADDATAPAGIGLKIEGGMPGDAERYRDGCRALAVELGYER
jgi:CheY-like chemotaxis protein/Tfp pilus assembly protein PilZ